MPNMAAGQRAALQVIPATGRQVHVRGSSPSDILVPASLEQGWGTSGPRVKCIPPSLTLGNLLRTHFLSPGHIPCHPYCIVCLKCEVAEMCP